VDEGQNAIDPARAGEYVGKRVLVGITYVGSDGSEIDQAQWHGVIEGVDPMLTIRLGQDELRTLPPHIRKAPPGEYRLRSTGEIVPDPDFLATWTIEVNAPPPHDRPASYVPPGSAS
jgi:hypothetical protein